MATTAANIAYWRDKYGLDPDPASDAIWAKRFNAGTHTHADMTAGFTAKKNQTGRFAPEESTPAPTTTSAPATTTSAPATTSTPATTTSSPSIKNYQRTDQHYAQTTSLAADRIRQIYSGDTEQPSEAKIEAMAGNAVAQGYGYFDTVRNNKDRYLSPVNTTDANRGGPDEEQFPDSDGNGIHDEIQIDYEARARAMYSWLPKPLLDEFIDHWVDLDNEKAAWGQVRQGDQYEQHFPGIRRADGSLRMSEQEYLGEIDGFEQAFESFGIPADTFRSKFAKFIENGQSAGQVRQRLAKRYTEIASMSDEIRGYYAEKFGAGDVSMAAMLASDLDPTMNPLVAEEQFKIAQVGGTGREFGFEMAAKEAERLADFGMTRQGAQGFFKQARNLVPTMRDLARRHNDPDDDFDIGDAADALIFEDPEERRRVNRLFAQEGSLFSNREGSVREDQGGGLSGLAAR